MEEREKVASLGHTMATQNITCSCLITWVINKYRYNNAKSRSPRGEIGRHKGLKSRGIEVKVSP